ncbi:hypothetical protein [Salinivibrio proteolyticus]|uniref:hypothetical protein n=1 Tax=Salinivibrio proteolyticus TaxID=334715 RepID=UPI000989022E|nr:hypothetical protein [Salinivibrio proteolyticus]OOF28594.1 hypothetical protein BZJ20_15905 [Salinivibrio proteolyticus]
MKDHDYVNFSQDHEKDYHLGLVSKSRSKKNRAFLVEKTQRTAKRKLNKTRITHGEFKPFVIADKPNLDDPQ